MLTCDQCKITVNEQEMFDFGLEMHPCGHTICRSCCCPGVPLMTPGHVCRCESSGMYNGSAHLVLEVETSTSNSASQGAS